MKQQYVQNSENASTHILADRLVLLNQLLLGYVTSLKRWSGHLAGFLVFSV